ncbi:hypothetical protein BH09PSE5_BH09PSE5_41880 [soil metagenome]
MHYSNNYHRQRTDVPGYRGRIPFELYKDLQNRVPQREGELDAAWLMRLKITYTLLPVIGRSMLGTPEFKTELQEAAFRRTLAQAGGRRMGQATSGLALRKLPEGVGANSPTSFAPRYMKDHILEGGVFSGEADAYAMLMEQFDATTPTDGSIFWSGINPMALVKLVDQWNDEFPGQLFGQLESTTQFRYVDNHFEHIRGDAYSRFTTESSTLLANAAKGHVTAITQFGLRPNSTFHDAELPNMLQGMKNSILKGQDPRITNITLVVIEPKDLPDEAVKVYTNNQLATIPLVKAENNKAIKARDLCKIVGRFNLDADIRAYWARQGSVKPSFASEKVLQSFRSLVKAAK